MAHETGTSSTVIAETIDWGLVGGKDVTVYVFPFEDNSDVKLVGTLQSIGINLGQSIDRLMSVGSVSSLPFAGYYMAQLTARKFLLAKNMDYQLPEYFNLQSDALPNPISLIVMYIETDKHILSIGLENAHWNAHSISVQAGQVLVFEDISFECEDVRFSTATK